MERADWLRQMRSNAEALYDRFSSRYWVTWGMAVEETHRACLQKFLARVPPGGRILSAACGAGRFDGMLLEAGHSVVGIDQSAGVLQVAKEHFPEVAYEKMALQEMNYREVFDGIICMDAMEHICPEDYPAILRRFQEALKPGGVLYFTADREEEPDFDLAMYFEQGKARGLPIVYGEVADEVAFKQAMACAEASDELTDRAVYHYYPPLAKVREWIAQAGLTIVEERAGSGFHHFLASRRRILNYINPAAPRAAPPAYPGEHYDTRVPATLDLAERARLCVNALTETVDPAYDDELYWIVDLLARQPAMYHTVDDHVQAKFFQALPLDRTACGSMQNLDVEHRLMQTYLRMQGEDGLIYIPIGGRPWALPPAPNMWAGLDYLPTGDHWCSVSMNGRLLGGLCVYALKDPAGPWPEAAHRLARGLMNLCVVEGDIAWLRANCWEPGRALGGPAPRPVGFRAGIAGWVAQGLAQCARALGNGDAGRMAARLMRYILRDSGYFGPRGEFTCESPDDPGSSPLIHFHAHTNQIMSALEAVQATGDPELLALARRGYDYAVSQGEGLVGFFPEWLSFKGGAYGEGQYSSEICEVADMIAAALKLSALGVDKWDDADRWLRNQFAECQLTDTAWLTDGRLAGVDRALQPLPGAGCAPPDYGTTDRVIERAVGSFSGWPSANDFVQGQGWSIMHCCTGNGTRAVYYAWEKILSRVNGRLDVNLLLNRASRWADVHSHIPFCGRVDVGVKEDVDLAIRLPEWVALPEARCSVDGSARALSFDGRYARVGPVGAGQRAVLEFPIRERTDRVFIERRPYTLVRRGNDVVWIDPPGRNRPLYQRGHFREGPTLWKDVRRFAPSVEIPWC